MAQGRRRSIEPPRCRALHGRGEHRQRRSSRNPSKDLTTSYGGQNETQDCSCMLYVWESTEGNFANDMQWSCSCR